MMTVRRWIGVAGLALLLSFGVEAGRAQSVFDRGLTFETVGDQPLDAYDLDFDTEGGLCAPRDGLWCIPPGGSVWQEVNGGFFRFIMATHPDTVYAASRGFIARSVDGGQTFPEAQLDTGGTLFETAITGPNRGRLLAGAAEQVGAAYSSDRGATWTLAEFEDEPTLLPFEVQAFAELTEEGPLGPGNVPLWPAGRLVAACLGGMAYSDDGGAFWAASDVWDADLRYVGWSVARVEGSAPGAHRDRLVAMAGEFIGEVRTSDDGGATWTLRATLPHPATLVALPPEGGAGLGVVLAVLWYEGSAVWASADGGAMWSEASGPILSDGQGRRLTDALVGPDGRLYVAFKRAGGDKEWVYRTEEAVVPVGNAPAEAPEVGEEALRVWPNPARGVLHVRAEGEREAVVFDVLGRGVLRVRLGDGAEADVSGLPPGVYVVRVGHQSAVVTVRR